MPTKPEASFESSGVEALLERLREQGVAAGQRQAETIVADAQARADWLLAQARAEAEALREQARDEAQRLRKAGEEALKVAARDVVLNLSDRLGRRFAEQIRWLAAHRMEQAEFMERLILAVAGRARRDARLDQAGDLDLLLPEAAVGLEELRHKPEELREGSLSHFVLAVAGELLRDGVELKPAALPGPGIRVRLRDQDVEVDLSAAAVAELLLEHLQPRFRALLEGIVR